MSIDENIYIGRVGKIAKNAKEITVYLEVEFSSKPNLISEPIFVRMNESDQILVPFFICFYHFDKNKLRLEIDDLPHPDDLDLLKNKSVYISKKLKSYLSSDLGNDINLTGFKVLDKKIGEIGKVTDVLDIKENPLLTVLTNQNKEIYIPLNENFILGINPDDKIIYVEIPEDLLQL
jgi:16S rRNA processing protein RimM